jgi:branched-chain amino acid transport system ATP-binding protein
VSAALEVGGLNAYYGKSQVVFDLGLTVEHGEIVTLLGRNGAGKTSTLLAIAGVVSSRVDRLQLDGRDISQLPPFRRVRAALSLVPSGSRAFPTLTVHENLTMVQSGRNGSGWKVEDAYAAFPPLAELRNASAGQLSGGERQMLAIGRAMVARPKVLMLDEPSEGLAPIVVASMGEMLRRLAAERGLAVLLTEQNHRLALKTADRAYFIEKGQIVWQGDSARAGDEEVITRYLAV